MFYFYVIQSLKDKKLYIGFTSDLKQRLKEHNSGKARSTKGRHPFRLVYYEAYHSKDDAVRREHSIKLRAQAFTGLKRRIKGSSIL
jgi:putative endonuclease